MPVLGVVPLLLRLGREWPCVAHCEAPWRTPCFLVEAHWTLTALVLLSFLVEVGHTAPSGGDGIWASGEELSVSNVCRLSSARVGRFLLLLLP